MTIRVVTDSTCDLPKEVVDALGITVIPLYINVGKRGYLDGIDISRSEFYQQLPDFKPHPTTAAPGTRTFLNTYQKLAEKGASAVLSIHISASLSATVEVALVAAKETTAIPVTVLDARQLSLGTGFQVKTAAEMVAEEATMQDILTALDDQIRRTHVFAALDTLEYLRRSGRMNAAVSRLGNLLQLKPLLHMYNGEANAERVRTRERATKRLIEILESIGQIEKVALVHTHAPERAAELKAHAARLLPEGDIHSVDITPVIGANIGPNAAGFACVAAQ